MKLLFPLRGPRHYALLIAAAALSLPTFTFAQGDTLDLEFSTSVTIEKPSSDTVRVRYGRGNGYPFGMDYVFHPITGTVIFEYKNGLRISWNQGEVAVGDTLPIDLEWLFLDGDFGSANVMHAAYVELTYDINFDSLFSNTTFALLDSLYPFTGVRTGMIPFAMPQRIDWSVATVIPKNQVDPHILENPFAPYAGLTAIDTLSITRGYSPYPCLELQVDAQVIAKVNYSIQNAEVCVRYDPSPQDTLCWAYRDSSLTVGNNFHCVTSLLPITIDALVPCFEIHEHVVAFCPVVVRGDIQYEVELEVEVQSYRMVYSCSEIPSGFDTLYYQGALTKSKQLYDQSIALSRASSDAIFIVPVPGDTVSAPQPVAAAECTVGTLCEIAWTDPDPLVVGCCEGAPLLVDIGYIPVTVPDSIAIPSDSLNLIDSLFACGDTVVAGISADLNSYSWLIPNDPCFDGNTDFVIAIQYNCNGQRVTLAYGSPFRIRP